MPPNETLDELTAEITETKDVVASAVVFINGVPGLIAAAVAKAIQNGATAEELAPVTQLGKDLKAQSDALKAAITANTPVEP